MKDKKDIQYKIFKSEACGHTIQYKMVDSNNLKKNENRLQNQLATHAIQGKKTGIKLLDNMIADAKDEKRMATPAEREELSHNLRVKKEKEKSPQKLAASEQECKCEDTTKKCECEDKEMKKREKFYIQKIQELRKQALPSLNLRQMYNIENSPARRDAAKAKAGLEEAPSPSPYQSYNIENSPARRDAIQAKAGNVKNFLTGQTSAAAAPAANMSMPGQTSAAAAPAANMSMPGQTATSTAAPTETPKAASAPKYDMKNPFKVENAKNFKDAFNQARSATGGGGNVFEYGGKKYHTYTQDEFKNPGKSGIQADNKFYKDWQARKDVTGPGAYYANKMNPTPATNPNPAATTTAAKAPAAQAPAAQAPAAKAPAAQAPAAQAPAAQKSNAFQKLTGKNLDQAFEQNFPKSVSRKENGSTLKTFPSGKKELTNL